MKKMLYARDLAPAFRTWVGLHRRHETARAALEAAGEFAARIFFLNAAVFSRWRCATQSGRRERTEEAAEENRAKEAEIEDKYLRIEHLLGDERKRWGCPS
jgi:hypothetical protein